MIGDQCMSIHRPRDDDKRLALYFTFDISIIGVLGRGKSSTAQSPGGGSIAQRNLPDIPGASHPFYFLLLHGSAARRGITIDRGGGKMDHTPLGNCAAFAAADAVTPLLLPTTF